LVAAHPLSHRVANGVADVGREPAFVDLKDLVPATRLVKAERRAVLQLRERVLELVAVMEDLVRGQELLERRLCESSDPAKRIRDLIVLRLCLRLVGEILEAAPAAEIGRA